ncbi:SMP-30/gluconolactonase/LRE family protein [Mariniphaga sp.]|uniref:SMP-30/gluconolactonase/LRE family protein n=1 Tax=Mariniphaga sp. TaxID=1954475 RepID=UPI0035663697
MDKRQLKPKQMKTKIYITLILVQCTLALSFVSQAQFPEFTIIDTGAIYTSTGHHVASGWFDMDNDNDMDLIITNSSGMGYTNHPNLLYKNELNGNFIQVTNTEYTLQSLTVGLPGPFGDIDNDGDQDLINADWIGTDYFIYQNDGYGNFESLKNLKQLFGFTSVLFDLDNDSFPDIIQFHEDSSRVYANDGTGNFVDYRDLNIPCQDSSAVVHSIALGDADDDGDFDLYIGYTNVYGGSSIKAKNEFFLNNGSGRFIRQSDQAIIVQDLAMTPSINWLDYDNDGDMDLYVLNSFDKSPANSISGALFENKGELVFEKHIIEPAGYRDAHRVSSVWGDLDNDADLDLYITIEKNGNFGHVSPIKHNLLLQNNGDGTFSEVYNNTLATESSHTATFEDIDNDGFLDVLLVRFSWANNGRNTLCMNEGNDNSWLILNLEGTSSNKTAFGTRIIAKAAINGQHIMQTREITPMSGHATYNSTRVHFGLGDAAQVDTLIIRWPSGNVDEYLNVAANEIHKFIEKDDTEGAQSSSSESKFIHPNSKLTEVFSGGETFLEGATMSGDGILFFSDIAFTSFPGMKAGIIWTFNPQSNEAKVYRSPSGMSNGLMFDSNGDLIACEGADFGGRKVTKTDMKTGKSIILAALYNGRPFNSPNDLAIDQQGRIYFTDPRYFGYESIDQPVKGVYRIDKDNSVHLLASNVDQPNGIMVSPDQKTVYVANCNFPGNGNTSFLPNDYKGVRPTGSGSVFAYNLLPDGSLQLKSKLIDFGADICPDGMTIDKEGNLYIALGDKVGIFSPGGKKMFEIKVPQATNLCFGTGKYNRTLFIAGGKSVYAIETLKEGFNVIEKR